MSTCRAQSDSMQENPMLVALGKGDGKGSGWVGEYDNKGRKTWGRGRGKGDEEITKLKTTVISAAAKRKQCLLLGKACLAACSRGWVQHFGTTRYKCVPNLLQEDVQI